jgi:hypothetical protein
LRLALVLPLGAARVLFTLVLALCAGLVFLVRTLGLPLRAVLALLTVFLRLSVRRRPRLLLLCSLRGLGFGLPGLSLADARLRGARLRGLFAFRRTLAEREHGASQQRSGGCNQKLASHLEIPPVIAPASARALKTTRASPGSKNLKSSFGF